MKKFISISILLLTSVSFISKAQDSLLFKKPAHGFVSREYASKWEEGLLVGNGTIGALIYGNPLDETIIISHENLFMPENYPNETPPVHQYLKQIREYILSGDNYDAAELMVQAGIEAGIPLDEVEFVWTDVFIPACRLELESVIKDPVKNYTRGINYENGEARVSYIQNEDIFDRTIFISRADSIGVMHLSSSANSLNYKFRLVQTPDAPDELISSVESGTADDSLYFSTRFSRQWDGSLKGYNVAVRIKNTDGAITNDGNSITVNDASEILLYFDVQLSYSLPLEPTQNIDDVTGSYSNLREEHENIHSEMFKRFSLKIGDGIDPDVTAEEMINPDQLNDNLINQLMDASRYISISSTGENPPTLQGIWGASWRPEWSSDFTLNGNVPSAIASGFNTNLFELPESHLNMMWNFFDDFKYMAKGMYNAPGIFVPSRISNSGINFTYSAEYPMLGWFTGSAWTSQFFYDYWQYTGDTTFLKEKAIPFMQASMDFYESIITRDDNNNYAIIPSYSPEQGPEEDYKLAINATMDVGAIKQLSANLLTLSRKGYIVDTDTTLWNNFIDSLPRYQIQSNGDFKEWLWPSYQNQNEHRHASHFYPVWYEPDVEILKDEALLNAVMVAVDKRLEYRRELQGGEMSFGIFQKGLAASHVSAGKLAYECVEMLSKTFWNKAFNSYHNPNRIFNVDISGGLPSLVTEMLVQSAHDTIYILPALYYHKWSDGKVSGVQTRSGVRVNLEWKDSIPHKVELIASRNTSFTLKYNDFKKTYAMNMNDTIVLTSDSLPNEVPYLRQISNPEPQHNLAYKSDFENLLLFPNPSDGSVINIRFSGMQELVGICILDINGRIVLEMEKFIGEDEVLEIPLNSFKKGIYIVSVSSNSSVKNARLVIQ